MANYGTHTYNTEVYSWLALSDLEVKEDDLQWEASITVACTSPHRPAQLCGPPEHCDPEQAAEYEFDEFRLSAGGTTILKSTDWAVAEALLGANIWGHLYDEAGTDAEENYVGEEEP